MDLTNLNLNKDRNKMRRKPSVDLSTMVYGKVPPQAKELEEAVLGAIMLEKSAFDTVVEILKPECFYLEGHQRIYRAMQGLAQKSQPIDILTVVEELKFRQELEMIGGPYYVTKLTNAVVSSANIETHSRIILQKFIQRELIRISGEIIGDAYEDSTDVFDLLDDAESKLFGITNNHLRKNFDSIDTVLVKTIQRIEDLRHKQDEITGVPSGFPTLDKITYGWQPTDLIILAARPAVGKTAFALNLARNAALHPTKPVPVAFFSLEMSSAQLVQRILSAESEIFMEKIARGRLEEHEMKQLYKKGIDRLAKAPIFIDDTPALNIFELRAKCRRLKNKHNVGFIIIDYLQLMSGAGENRNGNREQEISRISRDLKGLAKELQVPIIALSQLSRAVESRKEGEKIPQLSDLRESGAIEQDADMVMFLYRPEYYGITANEMGESNKGETHVKIAKHRNGSLDTVKLRALLHIQKFTEYGEDDYGGIGMPAGGSWKPVQGDDGGARLYIQAGSRMKDVPMEDDDAPVLTMHPYFYISVFEDGQTEIMLDEDNSRHAVQVLRMQPGEILQLTDGKGVFLTAVIAEAHKKKCRVTIQSTATLPPPKKKVAIAISPLKNAARFEWFLEKAAEIGVSEIIPLLSEHTERQHLRPDRLHNILVSALLQSQQTWLPILHPLTPFSVALNNPGYPHRLIAHLDDTQPAPTPLPSGAAKSAAADQPTLIFIGPEGDFSPEEIASALKNGFVPVTLGENRLRTETAGVVAATLLCIG